MIMAIVILTEGISIASFPIQLMTLCQGLYTKLSPCFSICCCFGSPFLISSSFISPATFEYLYSSYSSSICICLSYFFGFLLGVNLMEDGLHTLIVDAIFS